MMAERGIIKARKRQSPPIERSFQFFPCEINARGDILQEPSKKTLFCFKIFFFDFRFRKSELVKVLLVCRKVDLESFVAIFWGILASSHPLPFSLPRDQQPSIQKMRRRHHYMKRKKEIPHSIPFLLYRFLPPPVHS